MGDGVDAGDGEDDGLELADGEGDCCCTGAGGCSLNGSGGGVMTVVASDVISHSTRPTAATAAGTASDELA